MIVTTTVEKLYNISVHPVFTKLLEISSTNNNAIMRLSRVMSCLVEEATHIEKQRIAIYKKYADEEVDTNGVPTGKLIVREADKEVFSKEINEFLSKEESFKFDYLLDIDDLDAVGISLNPIDGKVLEPILNKRKFDLKMKKYFADQEKELAELEKLT